MKPLIQSIISYLQFLERDCGIAISIHFGQDNFYSLPDDTILELKRFNTHKNPYCMRVKRQHHNQCIQAQRSIMENCQCHDAFCHICHAGVLQHIHPLIHDSKVIGFAAVSGFRRPHPRAVILDTGMWENFLSSVPIPTELYESALTPLNIMIDKLFRDYAVKRSDEYSQLLHYLNEYHANITLDDLCQHFGRSRSHISHLFKNKNGASIHEYCNALKLEDAKHLLEISMQSVTEIGYDVGFHDTSYFIRLFRNKYGLSPHKYRTQCNKRP